MERLVNILRAAGETTRLRLLAILAHGELTVTELTQILGQSQPRISRHLKLLVDAGLLERKPEGSWAFYRLAGDDPLTEQENSAARLARLIVGLVPKDDAALARDLARLDTVKVARAAVAEAYFRTNAQNWDSLRALHVPEERVERALLEMVGPGPYRHCVDVGTGTGRMLELVGERIERGDGIDVNHEMLTLARTTLDRAGLTHCQVRHGDFFSLPFPSRHGADGSVQSDVDLVIIHQVLHYLTNPAASVMEAARILAPGGTVLVVDFAPHNIEELRDVHAHRRLGFSEAEVQGYLQAAGLVVEDVRHLKPEPQAGKGKDMLTVSMWRATAPTVAAAQKKTKALDAETI